MAFLTSTRKSEGSVSKLAMLFALIFVAIGILLGAVLERLERGVIYVRYSRMHWHQRRGNR
jgi:hypothetical protein